MRTVLTLGLLAALSLASDRLIFDDGHMVTGKVVSTTATSVTFQPEKEGAEPVTVGAEALDPFNFYSIRERTMDPRSIDDRLALATFALDHRLYKRARIQARAADEIDKAKVDAWVQTHRKAIREGLAELLLQEARDLLRKDKLFEARGHISMILTRYPDTRAAESARDLLDTVQSKIGRRRTHGRSTRERIPEEKREQYLAPAIKDIEAGESANHNALKQPLDSKSMSGFMTAGRLFDNAVNKLEALIKGSKDEALTKEAKELLNRAKVGGCEAYVNQSEWYLSRGNGSKAAQAANRALKHRPESTAAQSARARAKNPEPYGWGVTRLG
ncbi:MAG: hypothetical protein ACYTHK_07160 [Planctomycetota bacterium]|jgi:hypothetical protein